MTAPEWKIDADGGYVLGYIIKDTRHKRFCEIFEWQYFYAFYFIHKDDAILSKFIERLYLLKQIDDRPKTVKILKNHKFAGRFPGNSELSESIEKPRKKWLFRGHKWCFGNRHSISILWWKNWSFVGGCFKWKFDLMRRLIDGGADLNRLTARGSALYLAFIQQIREFRSSVKVSWLIIWFWRESKKSNQNINTIRINVHICIQFVTIKIELVKYLLDRGANISQFTWNLALESGLLEMVHLLYESGVINFFEHEASKCLYYASPSNSIEMVKYILNLIFNYRKRKC